MDNDTRTSISVDAIDARYSRGLIINNSGTITQNFVTQVIQQTQAHTSVVLHELHAIRENFTGRTNEIEQLIATACNAHTTSTAITICSSVTGMGGVGKSALANVIAHALCANYPDMQLWLDLGAHSVNPRTPSQELQRILQTFATKAKLPEDDAALRSLYLQHLSGKRALVVIDDCLNDDDLSLLLPPPGCLALITSRNNLATGNTLRLNALPRAEAIALLRRFRPALSKAEADELAALCGDLPVALNVAGSCLKYYTSMSATHYLATMRETPFEILKFGADEKNNVERVFAHSAARLSAAQRAAWCALSIMPADFDRAAGVAVSGVLDDKLGHPLDELVALNLLEYNPQDGRFGWHNLLQKFAMGGLDGAAGDEARARHVGHYMGVANNSNWNLYNKGQQVEGMAQFDRERAHIEAAFNVLSRLIEARLGENIAQALIYLVNAVTYTSDLRFHSRLRITWLQTQADAAHAIGDKSSESNALSNLGAVYANVGEVRKAIGFYEHGLVIFREIGDRRGEGAILGNLGVAYKNLGDVRTAIEFYEQAIVICREIGNRRGEGDVLSNLGVAYAALDDMRTAIELYEQAIVICHEVGDRRGEGVILGNLGVAYKNLGDVRAAIEFYEQAIVICREIGDQRTESAMLGNLGLAHKNLSELDKAIDFYEQAIVIYGKIGDWRGEANACWNLGLEYEAKGDLPRAVELMQVCASYLHELGHPDAKGTAAHVAQLRAKLPNP